MDEQNIIQTSIHNRAINEAATERAVAQQVDRVFKEAAQFDILYQHFQDYARANGWVFGAGPTFGGYVNYRTWATKYGSKRRAGPTFKSIGELFDFLMTEIEAKRNGTSEYQYE
jgi:hypothetical protein